MNEYELLYIVHARKAVDDVPAVIDWVSGLVEQAGGEVLTVDNWGRRRLAYLIDHEFEGTYVLTTLRLPPQNTRAVESPLIISEDTVRHMLIRGIIPFDGPGEQERADAPPVSAPVEDAVEAPSADRAEVPASEAPVVAEAEADEPAEPEAEAEAEADEPAEPEAEEPAEAEADEPVEPEAEEPAEAEAEADEPEAEAEADEPAEPEAEAETDEPVEPEADETGAEVEPSTDTTEAEEPEQPQ